MADSKKNQALKQNIEELEKQASGEKQEAATCIEKLKHQPEVKTLKERQLKDQELHVLNVNYSFLQHQYKSLLQRHTLLLSAFTNEKSVTFEEYISAEAGKVAQHQIRYIREKTENRMEALQSKIEELLAESASTKKKNASLNNGMSTKVKEIRKLEARIKILTTDAEKSSAKIRELETARDALNNALKEITQSLSVKAKELSEMQSQYNTEKKRLEDEFCAFREEKEMLNEIFQEEEEEKDDSIVDHQNINHHLITESLNMYEVENAASQQPTAEQPDQTATSAVSTDLGVEANRPNGSLYVGNLSPEVDEQVLYPLFSQVGQINSIRVCRDVTSRRSLGYAYVNFNVKSDPDSAQRAIDTLNYHCLHNKPICIMWASRDPISQKHDAGNLFVKNLAKSIDHKELHRIFSEFGDILSLKISQDDNSVSRGYGFVLFKKEEDAKEAMKALHGKVIDDKALVVLPFAKRDDKSSGRKNTNVYIKLLPENVDEGRLREICSKYGEITSVKIERDEKGASKKFGYINFKTATEAELAINGLKTEFVDGQHGLYAAFHEAKLERAQLNKRLGEEKTEKRIQGSTDKNIYVKFLPESFDDTKLKELFSPFGVIDSVKVATTPDGISRGFGFVCFSSASDASTAVSKMNHTEIEGKPLQVCLSQRKEVRLNQQARLGQRDIPTALLKPELDKQFPWPYPFPPMFNNYSAFDPYMFSYGRGNHFNHHDHSFSSFHFGGRGSSGRGLGSRQYFSNPAGQKGVYQIQRSCNNQDSRFHPQTAQAPFVLVETVVPDVAVAEAAPVDVVEEADAVEIETFTAASLVDRSPEEQRRIIGNKLYLKIQNIFNTTVTTQYPLEEVCGKITGMLLEMSVDELLMLIDSNEILTEQVQAAHEFLLSNYFMANEDEVANEA